jgi:phosphotransferase system enzyme I (PtsI)
MYAHSLPKIKKMIRNISLKDAKDISSHVLSLSTFKEINNYVNIELKNRFSDDSNFAHIKKKKGRTNGQQ